MRNKTGLLNYGDVKIEAPSLKIPDAPALRPKAKANGQATPEEVQKTWPKAARPRQMEEPEQWGSRWCGRCSRKRH